MEWLGRGITTYDALWRWSTTDLDGFWRSVGDYFEVRGVRGTLPALAAREMPGARWFPHGQLNYVEQIFRHATDARPAIIAGDETGHIEEIGWRNLQQRVSALAATLRSHGVVKGDRVAAYLPNRVEAVVAFLATASVGAIWSLCSTDMGIASVVDRIKQIEPKVLIATEGYRFNGRVFDRREIVAALRVQLPSVQVFVRVPSSDRAGVDGRRRDRMEGRDRG